MAALMAAGTGGANRPAGSATEVGTVTDGHSVGTQKLIGESHMDGQGVPTRLQAPFRALVTGEALESRVERKCAVEKGWAWALTRRAYFAWEPFLGPSGHAHLLPMPSPTWPPCTAPLNLSLAQAQTLPLSVPQWA